MLFEDFEKEITLSASPYPGDDFHEVIMFSVDYAFEKKVTFDCHDIFPVYKSLDLSKNLKALALYHISFSAANKAVINLWIFLIFELWRCSSKNDKKCDILLTVFGRIQIAQKTFLSV